MNKYNEALANASNGQNSMGCSEANYNPNYLIVGVFTQELNFEDDKEFDRLRNKVCEIKEKLAALTGIRNHCFDNRLSEKVIRENFWDYFSEEARRKVCNELGKKEGTTSDVNMAGKSLTLESAVSLYNEMIEAQAILKKYCDFKKLELFKKNTDGITEREFELMEKVAEYASEVFY